MVHVLITLYVPFNVSLSDAHQSYREPAPRVYNVTPVQPTVSAPGRVPEEEQAAPIVWVRMLDHFNAHEYWSVEDKQFLSGLQWYQRLLDLGEAITP